MQAPNVDFTLPKTLYQSENEVWENLSKVDLSKIDLSFYNATEVTRKRYDIWLKKLLNEFNRNDLHPLDFPLVRFFLNHQDKNTQAHLLLMERPESIEEIYKQYGYDLGNKFYCEISPFSPQFIIELCALEAELECAKFIEEKNYPAKIDDFHTKVDSQQKALDISFNWKGKQWYADAKNMFHEDGNLVFIEHVLAGIFWLKVQGNKIRQWNNIKLEGTKINHSFRNKAIQLIHKNLDKILTENEHPQEISIDDFNITKSKRANDQLNINLKESQNNSSLTITLNHIGQTNNRYSICPPVAYWCNASLDQGFWGKLKEKIQELSEKIKTHQIEWRLLKQHFSSSTGLV